MDGIEKILNIIQQQQKEAEESILNAAKKKADHIFLEGREKAQKAYSDQLERMTAQLERDHTNACASVDADMKRRYLACKVECIDAVIAKTLEKLSELPDREYFELLKKLAARSIRSGDGVISLSEKDLQRMPPDFETDLNGIAQKAGGTIKVSKDPADIRDGFVLTYGLISENCGFSEIMEAEKEAVRDTAAQALFGQVS